MRPAPPRSDVDPTRSALRTEDLVAEALLRLPDERWQEVLLDDLGERDAPYVTGDPVVDAFERGLWEANHA